MAKPNFNEIEEKIKKYWSEKKVFEFNGKSKGEIFSVDTPPPYISGKMHIGHAFGYSQQDFIVRFMRMSGKNIFYPFGTDDNGLPTERYVEKTKKIKSKSMSRADFIELCLGVLKEMTPEFIQGYKNLGISCDYDLSYSTIDKHSQKVSQKSFIELYNKNHIYVKKFPTLWCTDCQTTIAQAELEDKEGKAFFSTLKFNVGGKDLLIATTRPELLGACVSVFVNPEDKRYKDLIGKKVKVPLQDFEVPIIADESADMEKGTGVLMVCSYGDKFDVEAINKHCLKPKLIISEDGRIDGLKINEKRKKILEELGAKGLIIEKKEIDHVVNVHDKCGKVIEFLDTEQWFIRLLDKKKELIEQGRQVKWYPEFMFKRYENWVKGLEWDWSISRERHFGVPIPVWKCSCGEVVLPLEKELPVDPLQVKKKCPKCGEEAKGEERVLDTWATSSMTPQIASGLVKGEIAIPFSLRPQGHDIIRTWAFYTLAKSYLHEGKIPWKDIVVSGFVGVGGEKMSKSKGTGVDPQKALSDYGADALRYWAAGSKLGNDLDYQEKDLVTGKKLVTKLINASRFVFMNLEGYDGVKKPETLEKVDELFLTKVDLLVGRVTKAFEKYEYSKAKKEVDDFFWKVFTDNYLEIVKKRVYQGEGDAKLSAQYALYNGLLILLKLFAPIIPFVTEEIYLENYSKFEKGKSIHLEKWPVAENVKDDEKGVWDLLVDVVGKVRGIKSEKKKAMNSEIKLILSKGQLIDLKEVLEDLKNVTGAVEIVEGKQFRVEFV